jgi:signal transduction histidine kinase
MALLFALVTLLVGVEAGAPPQFLIADTGLGLLFMAAGMLAWERRPEVRSGPLLLASGVLWFVGSYAPTGFTPYAWLGFTFERYYDVVLALLVLSFPAAALGRTEKLVLAVLAGAFVLRSSARLLIGHPDAVDNPIALHVDPLLFDQTQLVTSVVIVLAAMAVALLAWRRLHLATGASRRILGPVAVAGLVAALAAAYDAAELIAFILTRQPLLPLLEPWQELSSWALFGAVALVPLGFLAGSLRLRMRHGVIAPLAVELYHGADSAQLESALRHALGDPSLNLLVFDSETAVWRDAAGRPIAPPLETSQRAVMQLVSGKDEPMAAVLHDPALREDPALVAAAAAVLRFAVENERLAADLRRQLAELRASRARVLEAAEQERTRIERDLHDGVQQRLLAVALSLQEARQQARRDFPQGRFLAGLEETAEMLLAAIDELRETARGIHPALLSDEGLGLAVTSLARRAAVPVSLELELDGRLPPAVETTAYYVVAEALTNITRHARASTAHVRIARFAELLEVEVSDDGDGGADASRGSGLRGLADRLDAVAGRLEIDSPAQGGTRLRALIPCA